MATQVAGKRTRYSRSSQRGREPGRCPCRSTHGIRISAASRRGIDVKRPSHRARHGCTHSAVYEFFASSKHLRIKHRHTSPANTVRGFATIFRYVLFSHTERGVVNGMRQLDDAGQCFTAFKNRLVHRVSPDQGTVVFRDLCHECVQRHLKTSRISNESVIEID